MNTHRAPSESSSSTDERVYMSSGELEPMEIEMPAGSNVSTADEIQELQNQVRELSMRLATLLSHPQMAPQVANEEKVTKRLPPLAKFSGNRRDLRDWIRDAREKLVTDWTALTEGQKFASLRASLEGEAKRRIGDWQTRIGDNACSVEGLFLELERIYADVNARARAFARLQNLKQGKGSTRKYVNKFLEYEGEADVTNPDPTRILLLRKGLASSILDRVDHLDTEGSFNDYVRGLLRVADLWENPSLPIASAKPNSEPSSSRPTATAPAYEPMDWQYDQVSVVRAGRDPDVRPSGRRAKWVPRSEIDRRRQSGLCLRCGDSRHRIRRCPHDPAVNPNASPPRVNQIVSEPDLEDVTTARSARPASLSSSVPKTPRMKSGKARVSTMQPLEEDRFEEGSGSETEN